MTAWSADNVRVQKRRVDTANHGLLADRFRALVDLTDLESSLLRAIQTRARRSFKPDECLLPFGAVPSRVGFIVSGWAAERRELRNGRTQILSFLLPGDPVGFSYRADAVSVVNIVALSPLSMVDAGEFAPAWHEPERVRGLARGLDLMATELEWFRISQVLRLGRQSARERLANLFLELEYRFAQRGMVVDGALPMPLIQKMLADSTGLSVIHVNRTLQTLKREGLAEIKQRRLWIRNKEKLQEEGEFTRPIHSLASFAPSPA